MTFKVMGKVNGKCIDGKKAETIEEALIHFKNLIAKSSNNILLSIAVQKENCWYFLEESDIEYAKKLTESIFEGNAKFTKYAPSSIRLLKK